MKDYKEYLHIGHLADVTVKQVRTIVANTKEPVMMRKVGNKRFIYINLETGRIFAEEGPKSFLVLT